MLQRVVRNKLDSMKAVESSHLQQKTHLSTQPDTSHCLALLHIEQTASWRLPQLRGSWLHPCYRNGVDHWPKCQRLFNSRRIFRRNCYVCSVHILLAEINGYQNTPDHRCLTFRLVPNTGHDSQHFQTVEHLTSTSLQMRQQQNDETKAKKNKTRKLKSGKMSKLKTMTWKNNLMIIKITTRNSRNTLFLQIHGPKPLLIYKLP